MRMDAKNLLDNLQGLLLETRIASGRGIVSTLGMSLKPENEAQTKGIWTVLKPYILWLT